MPSDLERRLRDARPALPEPGEESTSRARAAVLERRRPRGVGPARWAGGRPARLLLAAALLAAAGGAVAATLLREGPATAAPPPLQWGPAELLSDRFATFASPAVAVSGSGDALLAWLQGARLDARTHAAGGGWSPAQTLSSAGAVASGPAAAMDAGGGGIVVWRERRADRMVTMRLRLSSGAPAGVLRGRAGESFVVVARRRAAGGEWGPLETVSDPSRNSRDAAEPQVAIARDGTALAAWPRGPWVEFRSRRPGGPWGPVGRLDAGGIAVQVRLALDPSGAAGVVWSARRLNPAPASGPRQFYVVRAALRPAGGAWEAPADVSGRLRIAPGGAVIAVDGRLRAAAVWGNLGDPTPGGDSGQVAGAVRRGGGGWSAPRALDPDAPPPPMGTLLWPKATVALDGDGTAVAVFNRVTGPAFATLGPDGAPSPPRLLGGRLAGWSTLQTDGTGGLLLVLRTPRGLELRSWRPGQEWTPARAVAGSSKANSPALAARSGGAILAWAQFRGTGSTPLQVRAALGRRVDSASRTEAP